MATLSEEKEANLNMKTICNELATVAIKFFSIGVQLNVPFHKLEEFKKADDPLLCLTNYVITNGVSQAEYSPLSWQCIVEALKSKSVCEPGLARVMAKKYCNTQGDSLEPAVSVYSEVAATSVVSSHTTSSSDNSWNPPSVDLASNFPYLSKKERKSGHYLQQLKDGTEKLKRKFDCLVYDLIEDLEKNSSLEKVVKLLAIHCSGIEKSLMDCKNLTEVFVHLKKFISFYDYGPIKLLTSQLASTAFKKKLKKSKKNFQNYAKHRICECPSDAFDNVEENEKTYVLKTELDIATLTLEEVEKLTYEMNKILGKTFLHFLNVRDGCTEFVFRAMGENEVSISEDQKKALKLIGVTSVKYGDELIAFNAIEPDLSEAVTKDSSVVTSSDSGFFTRNTVDTSTKLSDYSGGFIGEKSSYSRSTVYEKERDLKDVRIDMMIKAESKPQDLPFKSPLHNAILLGNLQQVKQLVKKNENPMSKDINGNSCLHYAAEFKMFAILKYLIEKVECPPGIEGWNGTTILHKAAEKKDLEMVQYLVESEFCKLDPAILDESGHSALHHACRGGDLKVVEYLIECSKEYMPLESVLYDSNSQSIYCNSKSKTRISLEDFTQSPLACACLHGNFSVVKYLVEECHCDPSLPQGTQQKVPIESAVLGNALDVIEYLTKMPSFSLPSQKPGLVFLAAFNGSVEVMKYLTQTLHCEFHSIYKDKTPLQVATTNGRLDVVDYFINVLKCDPSSKDNDGLQLIHIAAHTGDVNMAQHLIEKHSVSATSVTNNGHTPLQIASYRGHFDLVKYLARCNPSSARENIAESLHAAAGGGHVEIAQYFVKYYKCDPNCKAGDKNCTPLHGAAINGKLDVVKWLIEKNHCGVNSPDCEGRTPMQYAISQGNLSIVKYLTKTHRCDINHTDNYGLTVVHTAASFGELDILKYLIEKLKMNTNMPYTSDGNTPVSLAAINGHLQVVRYLLETGCQQTNGNNLTPLHLAAANGHLDIVKYVMNNQNFTEMYSLNSNFSPLYFAVKNCHMNVMKYLIEEKKVDESYLVHVAAEHGDINVVNYLIQKKKCESLLKDKDGRTPLHHAILHGHLELLQWFVCQNSSNYNAVCSDETYFQLAACYGDFDTIKYLVEELKCDHKMALYFAAQSGKLEIVKYFVNEKKCNPCASYFDDLPIHSAAFCGKIAVVKYFIEKLKCSPRSKGASEKLPLHYAASGNQLNVVKYLLERTDCDPCSEDVWNNTPLFYAAMNGHLKIVQYLICDKKIPFSISFIM